MNRCLYIDQIRICGILFVVLWHVYTIAFPEASFKNSLAPFGAMMPMITFISGYLFRLQYCNGKYDNYPTLVKNKAKRLLIPLLLFTPFYINHADLGWKTIFSVLNGVGPLWFLIMFFWQFCFFWIYFRYVFDKSKKGKYLAVLLFIPLMYIPVPDFIGIASFARYAFYFLLGGIVFDNKTVKSLFRNKSISWIAIALSFATIMTCFFVIPLNNTCRVVAGNTLRLSTIVLVSLICYKGQNKISILSNPFSRESFGIYLVHCVVIRLLFDFIPAFEWKGPVFMYVATIAISFGLVKLMKLSFLGKII